MHRRIWFLAVAAVAVLAVVGSASAMRMAPAAKATASANGFTMGKVAPFAKSWAATPRTPAARQAKHSINVAMEQDIGSGNTWNINQANSTLAWAVWVGWNPILRGPYLVDYVKGKYVYKLDLATKVTLTKKNITYHIRKNANWNWGGKVLPVTWKDFAYTVEALNNPKNQVSSNVGVNQIGKVTHKGNKVVTFWWRTNGQYPLGGGPGLDTKTVKANQCNPTWPCGAFADYRDLIGGVYPAAALGNLDFNTFWAKGVYGTNGKPVSDGPYLMTNYTRGAGVTLKANPHWYGHKPSIKTVNFKIITNVDSEIQAVRGGEVDAAAPQPVPAIAQLRSDKKVHYAVAPGNFLEHIDIQQGSTGPQTTPLLKQAWFRHVLMMGINRSGIIKAALPGVAPGLKPLDSLLFLPGDPRNTNSFHKWNYNPKKAISTLKAHGCTGGPSTPGANGHYYSCGGHPAQMQFMYASDNARRVASAQIAQANLAAVGIKVNPNPVPTDTLFGANGAPAGNYDLTEFAWGGSVDPGGLISIWGCGGGQDWVHYCNQTQFSLMSKAQTQLNVKKRNAEFVAADKIMSNDVPGIPLYALPSLLVYKKSIAGMTDNPAAGFTYDMEKWKWK